MAINALLPWLPEKSRGTTYYIFEMTASFRCVFVDVRIVATIYPDMYAISTIFLHKKQWNQY